MVNISEININDLVKFIRPYVILYTILYMGPVSKIIKSTIIPMRNIPLHADFCNLREMRYVHQNERTCRTEIELQVKLISRMNLGCLRGYLRSKVNFEKIQ